jgi:Zn finger protein HypA/HybF involved in hydrogenase expression
MTEIKVNAVCKSCQNEFVAFLYVSEHCTQVTSISKCPKCGESKFAVQGKWYSVDGKEE